MYAAPDPKGGALGSAYNFASDPRLNHNPPVVSGLMAAEAGEMLRAFFAAARTNGAGREPQR